MRSSQKLTDEAYLDLFKVSENKYLLGIYQDGITVFKQQIRALNIFHALIGTERLKAGKTVGIIGGGVAGLTFAAACLKSGVKVEILEKHSTYLHMQSGCDIRKIHPNIYEWPEEKSLFTYAMLPVLSWKYDTASNVCKQILSEFKKIETDANKKYKKILLSEYTDCTVISSIEPGSGKDKKKIKISFSTAQNNLTSFYDVLIFAVGYGIEKDSMAEGAIRSYWRNDALGQSFLNQPKASFLVSGDGDGGLIDLSRLLIFDFTYELVLKILQKNKNYPKLIESLLDIRKRGLSSKDETYLHDEFSKIPSDYFSNFIRELEEKKLLRKNTVCLNGRKSTFQKALDFKRVSLLNAFIAFLLERERKFIYISGDWVDIKSKDEYKEFQYVVRHGTDRDNVFKDLPLSNDNIQQLKKIEVDQLATFNNGIVEPRYNYSDLIKIFYSPDFKNRIEYFTPDTETFGSYFSNLLYKGIRSQIAQKNFRLTLHRVISLEEKFYYQQITPYPNHINDNRSLGRVHSIDRGIVGVAIKTGKPVLLNNEDQSVYEQIFQKLNLEKKYLSNKEVEAALAIPIVSTVSKKGQKDYTSTNLVLYVDSKAADFFTLEILQLIIATLSGFIHSINEMLNSGKITMEELEFEPLKPVNTSVISAFRNKLCCYDMTKTPWKLADEIAKLKFKSFHSFDIIYNSLRGI